MSEPRSNLVLRFMKTKLTVRKGFDIKNCSDFEWCLL